MNVFTSEFISRICSPTEEELAFTQQEYEFLQSVLEGTVFQSGSYARYTAISPLNDLDVFWVLSQNLEKTISSGELNVSNVLNDLASRLTTEYAKAKKSVRVSAQAHSVVIEFVDRDHEFSIDIIPAIEIAEKNVFSQNLYRIPEVGLMSKSRRRKFYEGLNSNSKIEWIKTDPKGYKEAAKITNEKSESFRKVSKLVKRWRRSWKAKKNFGQLEFKLKSFHIELLVQGIVETNPNLTILDTLGVLFNNFTHYLEKPQIKDRAQEDNGSIRYVDSYLSQLSNEEKRLIQVAIKSGKVLVGAIIGETDLNKVEEYLYRLINGEEFISAYGFDTSSSIKDTGIFTIDGFVRRKDGFLSGWIKEAVGLQKGLTRGKDSRQIDFKIKKQPPELYIPYWKVRNTGKEAADANQLRGEINVGSTLNSPEKTSYLGWHYVTCYLVDETNRKVIAENSTVVRII